MRSSGIIRGIWRRPILRRGDFLCVPKRSATSHIVFHGCCLMKNNVSGHPDERKTAKTVFRGTPTGEKTEKTTYSVDGIIRNRRKLRIPWAESSKNGKNCKFRGRNHQKSLKTANSVDGIVKKQRKLQILWTESSEIDENCKFRGQNHQKTEKTGFPTLGKIKITHFLRFPTLGKVRITHFLRFSLERKAVVAHRKRP